MRWIARKKSSTVEAYWLSTVRQRAGVDVENDGTWIHFTKPRWWNGRHERLKISFPKGSVGSSPTRGTKKSRLILDFLFGIFLINVL